MQDDYGWDDDELVELSNLRIPSQPGRSRSGAAGRQGRSSASRQRGAAQSQQGRPRRQRSDEQTGRSSQRGQEQRPTRRQESQSNARNAQARRNRSSGEERSVRTERSSRPTRQERPAKRQPARGDRRSTQVSDRRDGRDFADRLAATDRRRSGAATQSNISGWRGAVLKATGGFVNLGPSSHDRELARQHKIIRRPVTDGTIAVFSRKGGVGKTTISAYLGLTLAQERGGRIVALDGDAEAGSLGWLLAPSAPSTLSALASAAPTPASYGELRSYTTSTPEGLEVIIGEPAEVGPISTTGLEAVAAQLSRHYDISIFDTGAGVTRATGRVLVNSARTLLLVMSPSADSVRAAERTLAWLDDRPGEAIDENTNVIAVINGIPAGAKESHVERIESHFSERCAAVVRIPWDAHLATGSSNVSLDLLSKETREGFLDLAATSVATLARGSSRNGHQRAHRAS